MERFGIPAADSSALGWIQGVLISVSLKPKYNDDYNLSVGEIVSKLVDTSKVIELERIDFNSLPKKTGNCIVKRIFDIASCSVALIGCTVPMGIIVILAKADLPGPVFFRQERLGLNGKPITATKIRSMREDAEAMGAKWTDGEDPRVTKIGAKLRQLRLDELPQFWAVIKGDLSLVSLRPERKVLYDEYEKRIHGFSQRMLVTPGIAWDIIAPKPGAGEKSFRECESLPAYEGIREGLVMAA